MDDPTALSLPSSLPYPITITSVTVKEQQDVVRGTKLLEYSFKSSNVQRELRKSGAAWSSVRDDMMGSWESPVDGQLAKWESWAEPGAFLDKSGGKPIVHILEPCSHPVQLHGMCGVCGMDLTTNDYLSAPAPSGNADTSSNGRFEIAHDALGVTVSASEAKRLSTQNRDRLLNEKRLILIVDLDQTIIHTTVDPTVGDWMTEIELDEAESEDEGDDAAGGSGGEVEVSEEKDKDKVDTDSTTPPTSPHTKPAPLPTMDKSKEPNPNADALRDVGRFQLSDDTPGLPAGFIAGGLRKRTKRRGKLVEVPGEGVKGARWYYVKPRPGLQPFLDHMSKLYEMHVYTMGTRSYADAICKVIDPEGKIFGSRILSRDESGSMNVKSLMRLFPTDQSMVVIIDDRADVWEYSSNLIQVVPYDFFVGIGDINASFLPVAPASAAKPAPVLPQDSSKPVGTVSSAPTDVILAERDTLLDAQSEERPLAKKQEELEHVQDESSRKPLLRTTDRELDRMDKVLRQIHGAFYEKFDDNGRLRYKNPSEGCDVRTYITSKKSQVFIGCKFAFSGIFPVGADPRKMDVWIRARQFGAECVDGLEPGVTHLIAANAGTVKVLQARKRPEIKIVWLDWLLQSIANWVRIPEEVFLISPVGQQPPAESRPPSVHEDDDAQWDGIDDEDRMLLEEGDRRALQSMKEIDWDAADAELAEFLGSEAGDSESEAGKSQPPTPSKKRARFVDEDGDAPLASYKSAKSVSPEQSPERSTSPPKRQRSDSDGEQSDDPSSTAKKPKTKAAMALSDFADTAGTPKGKEKMTEADYEKEAVHALDETKSQGGTDTEDEGDDDFAAMLEASMTPAKGRVSNLTRSASHDDDGDGSLFGDGND